MFRACQNISLQMHQHSPAFAYLTPLKQGLEN